MAIIACCVTCTWCKIMDDYNGFCEEDGTEYELSHLCPAYMYNYELNKE